MTESGSTRRLAVLIDADNTSHKHAGALLEEVARYGIPTVKRAYGDWTTPRLNGWKDELNRNAISPVQQFAYTTGKNSTDSALIIDAMDLLYTGDLDAFAIVSSDSDFTRLVTRLRESGRTVYGLGRRRTPQSLVAACDKFIYLEVLGQNDDDGTAPSSQDRSGRRGSDPEGETDEDVPALPALRPMLVSAIDATSDDNGWSHLGAVGSYLTTRHASFDSRNYGFSKLISLARAQDFLEVRQDSGSAPKVRLVATAPKAAPKAAPTAAPTTTPPDATEAAPETPPPAKKAAKKSSRRKPAKAAEPAPEVPAEAAPPAPPTTEPATEPATPATEPATEPAPEPVQEPAPEPEAPTSGRPKVTTRTRSRRSTPTGPAGTGAQSKG